MYNIETRTYTDEYEEISKKICFKGGGLFDEVGMGKTLQIITLINMNKSKYTSISKNGKIYSKATLIISEFSNVLDMEKGGEISGNLRSLYEYVLQRLLYANLNNDLTAIEDSERVIEILKSGWKEMMEGRMKQKQPDRVSVGA